MTEEEWKQVSQLLRRASQISGFMDLGDDDLAQLAQIRERLSFSERARLSMFMSIAAGLLWYDAGNVLGAVLELDDQSSKEREQRPHVLIRMRDEYQVHVETIDIIESVRKDAAFIGHPAIVWAIKHWEQVIHAKRILLQEDIYSRDVDMKDFKSSFQDRFVKIAEQNLKATFKALEEGIKQRAIPAACALAIKIKELNLDDPHTFLRIAWEQLAVKNINPTETVKERLERINSYLNQRDIQLNVNTESRVTSQQVIDFLKSSGHKYVGDDEGDGHRVSYRPRWKIFQNAFARWYFNVAETTLQDYLTDAQKQGMSEVEYWQPSFNSPKVSINCLLSYILTQQLVSASAPFTADLDNSDLNL